MEQPPPYNMHVPSAPPEPPVIQVVIPQQISMNMPFGSNPLRMTCPHCHNEIVSKVEMIASKKTHIIALALCLFGFCCCAPCVYCIDNCQAKKHSCPKCRALLGIYDKVLGI